MSGSFVNHMPLSLLYAAVDSIKGGFDVDILDVRLCPNTWKEALCEKADENTIIVGISVMTGTPIRYAQEISAFVKQKFPQAKIVWGGPHATFNGSEILQDKNVDFAIAGYGSEPFHLLAKTLSNSDEYLPLNEIKGLIYRDDAGKPIAVPTSDTFEFIDFHDIPYHLIEADFNQYGQLDSGMQIFSMYSVMGCPYKCAFCSSPAQYREIKKKYQPLSAEDVADHIEFVHKRYGANYIYFIDDDSFAKLSHVEGIIDEINRRNIKIGLGFRGARINEIKRMSDEFLSKLAAAGTDIMHIGAESGSQRILDLIRKDCTPEDIIAVNQKMARHPEIKTGYNWIVGLPGETVEELRKTQKLMLRLITDNPSAILFIPNKFYPLPQTELFDLAIEYGYEKPTKLEDWIEMEVEGLYQPPWYNKEILAAINMMQVVSYFVDDKINKVDTGKTAKYMIARVLAGIYTPLARLRLKLGYSGLLIENFLLRRIAAYYRG